jgi:long-subunit fatty acid transport protein
MRQTAVTRYAIGCALALVASRAAAQATLGAQGFGYPPGQLSAYSRSLGGATGETDPLSPINPAALITLRRGGMYLQSEQESRSIEAEGSSGSTRSNRFPLFSAAVPITERGVLSISFSTMLDRTWGTETRAKQVFDGDSVAFTERFRSEGAINDVRVGGAWAFRENIIFGLGIHVFPGENRLSLSREYDDSLSFAPFRDSINVNYSGAGVSAGIMWRPVKTITLGASGRYGGTLKLRESDTVRTTADAPSRLGAGVRYENSGIVVAFRSDRTIWSRMAGLGSERATPQDTWDFGLGVDAVGPNLIGAQLALRAGARYRELPFLAGTQSVEEAAFTFGTGAPLARGRASIDLYVERAYRTAGSIDAKERSWTFGLGLIVRP